MARPSTVYLKEAVAPGGKDWVKGYIEKNDVTGVTICDRDDGRGQRDFYPAHLIQRISFETGW